MAINLDKNKEAILAAWNDVVSDKTRTDWALFGYEGNTMALKVVCKGDGGLEEMTEDLNSGKIMYAFCRILDPNTSLPKLVLINWQGEAAPMERKGICANHLRDVTNFLKGAHVTINARTEDDVDSDLIISKVAKSTVSSFNFKERSAPAPAPKPVGSVYKRTIPTAEINPVERDKFWEKEEIEERKRVDEDKRKAEQIKQQMEEERKRRELEEAKARELRVRERSRSITQLREAEQLAANGGDAERQRWEQQMMADKQDEEDWRRRSESIRNQRKEEAQALIAQRNFNARAVFEQNSAAGQLNNRPRSHSLQTNSLFSLTNAKDPHTTPYGNAHQNNAVVETKTKQVDVDQRPMARPDVIPLTPPQVSPPSVSPVEVQPTPVPTPQPALQQAAAPPPQSILKQGLPRRQPDSDHSEQEDDQDWNTPAPVPTETVTAIPAEAVLPPSLMAPTKAVEPSVEPAATASNHQPKTTTNDLTEQEKLEQQYNLYQQALREQELLELELRARALYDYQAADDTEISFDPDDIITHIEQIDEGWWQGMAPDGTYGLFPANYVELIE